jgi:oxygen-independent coproporphyrinogen-3 oxidase
LAGIYIHIPFCRRACNYCDFYFTINQKRLIELVNAICAETLLRKDELQDESIDTIYFGGGTPSLLGFHEIKLILDTLSEIFHIAEYPEITLEANPDDLTDENLQAFKKTGINRLSIGIQSFEQSHLKWMNRAHDAAQALACVPKAQVAGFNNISIDLIYGFPMMTEAQWRNNLAIAGSLNVQHLSCYSLTVEEKTKLAHDINHGLSADINEDQAALNLETLIDWAAQNSFLHYEISNFCKAGFESRHNSSYWSGKPYMGLGPAAHSLTENERKHNIRNLDKYIQSSISGETSFQTERLTLDNRYNEYIITGLRTKKGLNEAFISEKFGNEYLLHFKKCSSKLLEKKLLVCDNDSFTLNREGILLADFVMVELMKV